ncbi:tetratricopeptide repeat protein [Flavobacterium terrigena]|nr:tetratricopeptide repeat protein [Flavobacterium terrigena]
MKLLICLFTLLSTFCYSQNSTALEKVKQKQDAIIEEYYTNCALKHNYKYEASQWQACLDKGLAKDSTIAYLWQQKAMPLFKARKYEAGMVFLDKAVALDENKWLDYRAFIKCIFAKTFKESIIDFEKCKARIGNSYVMDHTYDFHIALCYLQLNEFEKAEKTFKADTDFQKQNQGEAHHLDLFYYGISIFEQNRFEEAITVFDRALKQYPTFSDVKFYKALCLRKISKMEEAKILFEESKKDLENGSTINEDQIHYEMYPYQIRKLVKL